MPLCNIAAKEDEAPPCGLKKRALPAVKNTPGGHVDRSPAALSAAELLTCLSKHVLLTSSVRLFRCFCFCLAQNGTDGFGVFAAHAVIHPCALGCFGIEVSAVVYQPLHDTDMAEPAGVV